jgi:hypothetical protein
MASWQEKAKFTNARAGEIPRNLPFYVKLQQSFSVGCPQMKIEREGDGQHSGISYGHAVGEFPRPGPPFAIEKDFRQRFSV